jgi:hypothetical protein
MESVDHRSAVGRLSEDLQWLEDHCRRQEELAAHAGTLRLASALTRNVIGPFLERQPAKPLHVAVVGGAGAGKSTVVNFLAGSVVAESNPQAGYTRHPTAFLPAGPASNLPTSLQFLGPLQRISQERPANLDEDVYQVRRIPPAAGGPDPMADFVVWDCPDMTTWASSGYVSRLMEVAALADVVVYVASDERYNDEVPTQFLHLLIRAGKAVVVVLTKVRLADADRMVEHFKADVLGRLPKLHDGSTPAVPVVAFPFMSAAERNDPAGAGAKYRVQLLNQILVQCESDTATRQRTVGNAVRYLTTAGDGLLDVARRDLAELDQWKATVEAGRRQFEDRYRREYLAGEQFHRFNRHRERLMDLLELPGAGRFVGTAFWVLRAPYRWGREYLGKLLVRPELVNLSEKAVLEAALDGWLNYLQAEALKRSGTHPLWKSVVHAFDAGLASQTRDRFAQEFRTFELKETDELERAGQEMVAGLERNPALLYTLRGGKLALDLAVIGAALYVVFTGTFHWYELLLIPLGVSVTHQAAELGVRAASETARVRVRRQREELVTASLSGPLAAWLAEVPTAAGTSIERLQLVLRRVPETIRQLDERVAKRAAELTPPTAPEQPTA